jgi:hypothetical protein
MHTRPAGETVRLIEEGRMGVDQILAIRKVRKAR